MSLVTIYSLSASAMLDEAPVPLHVTSRPYTKNVAAIPDVYIHENLRGEFHFLPYRSNIPRTFCEEKLR